MQVTNLVGLTLLSLVPSLVLADWHSEGLVVREAYPEAFDYYGELVAREAEAEADAYYADLYARDIYADIYARDAEPEFDWAEYQASNRRRAFQKRGKTTRKEVEAAETAYESKLDDIQIAEKKLKRMTEGPGKVAFAKSIKPMENAAAQLRTKHARLADQLARGKK